MMPSKGSKTGKQPSKATAPVGRPTKKEAAADGAATARPAGLPAGCEVAVFDSSEKYDKSYQKAACGAKIHEFVKRTTAQQKRWVASRAADQAESTALHHACLDYQLSHIVSKSTSTDEGGDGAGPSVPPCLLSCRTNAAGQHVDHLAMPFTAVVHVELQALELNCRA